MAQQYGGRGHLPSGFERVGRPFGMKAFTRPPCQIGCGLLQASQGSFGLALVELAERDQNVIAVAADTLDLSTCACFRRDFLTGWTS